MQNKKAPEMTKWERSAMETSKYSALPLVSLFVLMPAGALVGGVVGAVIASSVILGGIGGLVVGGIGGFSSGLVWGVYGMKKADFAKKKYENRVKKFNQNNQQMQTQKMGVFKKLSAIFQGKSVKRKQSPENPKQGNTMNKSDKPNFSKK